MAAGVLEQLPQVLGAAAAFMLGWAACDWVKTRQARKEAAGDPADILQSSAGPAEPITAGANDVTKVNNSDSNSESSQCHTSSMDVTGGGEGQQAVAADVIVEPSAEAEYTEAEPVRDISDEADCQDQPIVRDHSVRVMDSLIAVEHAE
ncbi:MAG: hypothetical protein IT462_07355 [Planctomycetes bacterium]|nr:hypothetical protein [Planctomycetota bacterium]